MMERIRASIVASLAALTAACSSNDKETPTPDPSVTTSSSAGVGGSGTGGSNTGGTASSSSSGAGGSEATGFVSGSRLRAKFVQGADGSKQFTGFYDTEKGVDCRFAPYAASPPTDEQGCFPTITVPGFIHGPTNSSSRYIDSNCTQKAAPVISPCPVLGGDPLYISEMASCYVAATYQVTGTAPGYSGGIGNCFPNGTVYVTTEVPIEEWVLGNEVIE